MVISLSSNMGTHLRVMMFIDGGYFTEHWVENECKVTRDDYDYGAFSNNFAANKFSYLTNGRIIRTYYYDGLPEVRHRNKHKEQEDFHHYLEKSFANYEVRTAQLIKRSGKWIQKGVDTILALDMLEKAYRDQYDIAILVAGDADHAQAVKAVKNCGKQVFGVYYDKSYSEELVKQFDVGYFLEVNNDRYLTQKKN